MGRPSVTHRIAIVVCGLACLVALGVPALSRASGWAVEPVASPMTPGGELSGLACSSASSCTTVGGAVDSAGHDVALAERWNGRAWKVQPIAIGQSPFAALACVSSTTCFAVGASGASRWNGRVWVAQKSPLSSLSGIACWSARGCIAVGLDPNANDGYGSPTAERWDGTRWTKQRVPSPFGGGGFAGISCPTSRACMAVGFISLHDSNGDTLSLAETWDGRRWTIQSSPDAGSTDQLYAASCPQPRRCIAVGSYVNGNGDERPMIMRFDRGVWSFNLSVHPTGATTGRSSASRALAARLHGRRLVREIKRPGAWLSRTVDRRTMVRGAPVGERDRGDRRGRLPVAVIMRHGGRGAGIRWPPRRPLGRLGRPSNGCDARPAEADSVRARRRVMPGHKRVRRGRGMERVHESGPAGRRLGWLDMDGRRATGTSAHKLSPAPRRVVRVADDVYAVGESSPSSGSPSVLIEALVGGTWRVMTAPEPPTGSLRGISCASATACVAVGTLDGQNVLAEIWDGSRWTIASPSLPPQIQSWQLADVSCAGTGACTAVGSATQQSGLFGPFALGWNGSAWSTEVVATAGSNNLGSLASVSCPSVDRLHGRRHGSTGGGLGRHGLGRARCFRSAMPVALRLRSSVSRARRQPPASPSAATGSGRSRPSGTGSAGPSRVRRSDRQRSSPACPARAKRRASRSARRRISRGSEPRRGAFLRMTPIATSRARGVDMSPLRCVRAVAAGVGLLLLASGAGTASAARWVRQQLPPVPHGDLSSVACPSTSACVAVGSSYVTDPQSPRPYVLRWTGTAWRAQHVFRALPPGRSPASPAHRRVRAWLSATRRTPTTTTLPSPHSGAAPDGLCATYLSRGRPNLRRLAIP